MRSFRIFICVLQTIWSFSALASPYLPQNPDEPGHDLPQIGSSFFDKIFSETDSLGQIVYKVPYPLANLLARIGSDRFQFVHSMFPFSRSLQRPVDLSYDPILNPRLVLASNRNLSRSKIFIGYVKARDQLEVISFNDEAGRYEFQVVRDYSLDPKVYYVSRGKCLSCHQDQAPIFAAPAWLDSTGGSMQKLVDAKLGLTGADSERKSKALRALFDTDASRAEIAILDAQVREANKIQLDERVWLWGCGANDSCRAGALLRALAPNSAKYRWWMSEAQETIRNSSLKDQYTYSSFLTSTELNLAEVARKYSPDPSRPSYEAMVRSPEALMEMIGGLYRLSGADNPATRRLTPIRLADLDLARLATFNDMDREALLRAYHGSDELAEAIADLYQGRPELFAAKAINKLALMRALLQDRAPAAAANYGFWLTKPTPPKVLLNEALNPVFETPQLNVFARHCQECHATGAHFPPQFLVGSEAQVIGKIQQLKPRILFKLNNNMMPPDPTKRKVLHESGDLAILLEYLRLWP